MRHFVFKTQAEAREAWLNYNGRRGAVRFFWYEADGRAPYYYGDHRGPISGLQLAWEAPMRDAENHRRMMALNCKCGRLRGECPHYKCNAKFNEILREEFAYDFQYPFELNAHHEYYIAIDGGERGGWELLKSSNDKAELAAWADKIRGAVMFHRSEIIKADAPVVKALWFFDYAGDAHFVTDCEKIAPALAALSGLGRECGVALFTYAQISKINAREFGLEAGAWISSAPKIITFPPREQK